MSFSDASDWYPKEPNDGHLEYILFLLAGLTLLNLFVFVIVAKQYKYKKTEFEKFSDEEDDENVVNGAMVAKDDPQKNILLKNDIPSDA